MNRYDIILKKSVPMPETEPNEGHQHLYRYIFSDMITDVEDYEGVLEVNYYRCSCGHEYGFEAKIMPALQGEYTQQELNSISTTLKKMIPQTFLDG